MFIRRLILSVFLNAVVFGASLMLLAGTWHWWRAWVLMGVVSVCTAATLLLVFRNNPDLLNERMKPPYQKDQPLADKIALTVLLIAFLALLAFIPLDVFRFHRLLGKPNAVVSSLGLFLFVAGWTVISLTFRENAYAAPVVRLQSERHHKVVDTGVYSIVRHPMYSGWLVLMIGMALWLESTAGAVAMVLLAMPLVWRILVEESFLKSQLTGYLDYTKRVRSRLVPGIW